MDNSQAAVEQRLASLRERDREFGLLAEKAADDYRRSIGTESGPYSFPDIEPFAACYPAVSVPRTGISRIAPALLRRIALRVAFLAPLGRALIGRNRVRVKRSRDWVVFVGPNCRLKKNSLRQLQLSDEVQNCEFIYGDSVHYRMGQRFHWVHQLRPQWSPVRLESHCYVGDVVMAARATVRAAGGIRALRRVSSHGRALRLSDAASRHSHVDVVLYESPLDSAMPTCDLDEVKAHLMRNGVSATVSLSPDQLSVHVERDPAVPTRICVIIPTRGTTGLINGSRRTMVIEAIRSLMSSSPGTSIEFLIVADKETPPNVLVELKTIGGDSLRIVEFFESFNFARKINLAAVQTDAEFLLLMNDDTEVIDSNVLQALVSTLSADGVSSASPVLLFEDGTIQSAGHILNPIPLDLYRGYFPGPSAGWGMVGVEREVSSAIAAFLMVRREHFVAVGGLSEDFPSDYNDVDFALKLQMLGKRTVVNPAARCFHFESKTREPGLDEASIALLGRRWQHVLENDPYGHRFLQRYELIWKSNEETAPSLDAAVGSKVFWERDEWDRLQLLEDRHLHRTRYFPKWIRSANRA